MNYLPMIVTMVPPLSRCVGVALCCKRIQLEQTCCEQTAVNPGFRLKHLDLQQEEQNFRCNFRKQGEYFVILSFLCIGCLTFFANGATSQIDLHMSNLLLLASLWVHKPAYNNNK